MPRPAGLHVVAIVNQATGKTAGYQISGVVGGVRIRRRAQSNDAKLAREEARHLEAELLRGAWHGERRGVRKFAEAVLAYMDAEPRSEDSAARVNRLLRALGDPKLGEIDQGTVTRLTATMLRPGAKPATVTREIVAPLRAVMRVAAERDWCTMPKFRVARAAEGRTRYFLPDEAERLIDAAGAHLRPLLVFLFGTGARLSEALGLDWRDVDLSGARAIFWADQTKAGKRRNAHLSPRVVVALANLKHRDGKVFRKPDGQAWPTRRERGYGGQIKTAWAGAIRRAGLDAELTVHDARHSWASWHYAINRDLLALKIEGGWSTVELVERYAHLLPAGQEVAIRGKWQLSGNGLEAMELSA